MLEILVQQDSETIPFWNNSLVTAIIGAILGGLAIYLIEIWKGRRSPRSALAWDYEVTAPQRIETSGSQAKLNISYGDKIAEKLVIVRFRLNNVGNTLIKEQYVRFAFPKGAKLLEAFLDPDTKDEVEASRVEEGLDGCRWKIGYLPPDEMVQFSFICDGGDWNSWDTIYPRNDQGVVGFQRRGSAKSKDDTRHLTRFLFYGSFLLVFSLFAQYLLAAQSLGLYFYWDAYWLPIAVTIVGSLSIATVIEIPGAVRAVVAAIAVRNKVSPSEFTFKGEFQLGDGTASPKSSSLKL